VRLDDLFNRMQTALKQGVKQDQASTGNTYQLGPNEAMMTAPDGTTVIITDAR